MIEWAKNELARVEHDGEGIQDHMDECVLELLEVLCKQEHSNFTAEYVLNVFDRLAHYLPLTPLTGEDDEWKEIGNGCFQNKRYPAVFKDADGRAYNREGKIFSDDGGETWFTNKDSKVYIFFPYMPPRHPEEIILNEEKEGENEQEVIDKIKDLSERVENIEKQKKEKCEREFIRRFLKGEGEMSQGEWILTGGLDYQCSNCGMVPIFRPYNFCPNCGADMREEAAKMKIADMRSITVKFTKIKELIDNWAVDDDEHVLLERIASVVNEEEEEDE